MRDSNKNSNLNNFKVVESDTSTIWYGKAIKQTKCYVTVEVEDYYGKGQDLIKRLFIREGEMWGNDSNLSFYAISDGTKLVKREVIEQKVIHYRLTQTIIIDNSIKIVYYSNGYHHEVVEEKVNHAGLTLKIDTAYSLYDILGINTLATMGVKYIAAKYKICGLTIHELVRAYNFETRYSKKVFYNAIICLANLYKFDSTMSQFNIVFDNDVKTKIVVHCHNLTQANRIAENAEKNIIKCKILEVTQVS